MSDRIISALCVACFLFAIAAGLYMLITTGSVDAVDLH